MKKFIYLFLFLLVSFVANSQTLRPATTPSPNSPSGFAVFGYSRADSGFIWGRRDTFPARFPTVIWHPNGNFYKTTGNGAAWTIFASSTAGTVGSVSGNAPVSVINGTSNPVISVDTSFDGLTTKKWLYKSIDSLGFLKLNIADTAAMLLTRLKVSDTAFMLSPYLRKSDTASLLSGYARKTININTNAPLIGGGDLSANRTISADTGRAVNQLVTGGSLTAVKDTLLAVIASSGGGTVLSVATTNGVGINSSVATATSTPNITISVDTFAISTRAWRNKGVDSAISVIPLRITDSLAAVNRIKAGTSGGGIVQANTGAIAFSWGGGGSQEVDFHGFAGYDANRSSSYTSRSFTDKGYVDSSLALRLLIGDTATMLSPYRRTSTKITNSDLVNSTISGISLGSNLNTLTFGTYLQGGASSYNGANNVTISTNATSTNAASTLVARDINGDFSARNISATLIGNASSASTVAITNDIATNATYYPMFSTVTTGSTSTRVSSSKLTYNPSTGTLSSTGFIGSLTGNASTATVLQTPRTINGVAFDGSANISISASVDSSLSAGYGITGSPFDGSLGRTWVIDTNLIIPYTDTLNYYGIATKTDLRNSPSGTITSIATNNGSGITGGTITSSGTLAIDTSIISTKANVAASLLPKLNISDTATMLSGLTLDRVLANGSTSGRNLTAGNASFTTVTTNLGGQSLATPFNIPVQNAVTGTLEAAFPDSIRTFQSLMPRPWRYDGGNGNRLANTAYGLYVLDSVTEGTHPILIGKVPDTATADAEFQGRFNTALGASVLPVARYISDYTAVGSNIGAVMDIGFYSTLVGHNVLNKSTNGSKVTSVGAFSLLEATNVVNVDNFGFEGLRYNQTGSFISNIGAKGMLLNSTGNYNFSGGYQGMFKNTTGSNNTNVGALGLIDLRATSDSISQFSDYSGTVAGTVKAYSASHGRTTGQSLIISGTTNYNGTYTVTVINGDEFYFADTYVADDSTGWWTLAGAEASNNTSIGYLTGGGIVTGSNNTIVGARVNGLASNLSNNIILADGEGNIKARHNASSWNLVDSVSALSFKVPSGTSSQFLKANGSLDNNTYLTSADISGKLNISDTASMLSNYRRTTTKITNSDLANSTISGISLGSNLPNLNTPYGMTGTNYNGSGFVDDWKVDTSIISTKANVTALLLPKLNLSDTASMLSNYRRKTTLIENADLRNSAITINGSSTSLGGSISVGTITSVSAGTGMSFTTITSSGAVNADTTVLATRAYAAGLDVAKANTSLTNVNGVLSSTYGGAGSVSGILKANGSGVVSAAVANTDYAAALSGTTNYLPKFTSSSTIGNSSITDDGTTVSLISRVLSGTNGIINTDNGNTFALKLLSNDIGTVGNYVGQAYGFAGTTYQKGAFIFESMDGNGRGKFHLALNAIPNSSNATLSDSKFSVDYDGVVTALGSFVKLGGTSSQYLMADGSVRTNVTSSIDTGRSVSQIVTGGSLNKVRDSLANLIVAPNIASGTYTPTLTAVTNVSSTTATACQYMRVGNTVTISGKVRVTGTTAGTTATISITLPIAQNNFANSYEAAGSGGFIASNTYYGATLSSNSGAQTIALSYIPTPLGNDEIYFTVTYQIK